MRLGQQGVDALLDDAAPLADRQLLEHAGLDIVYDGEETRTEMYDWPVARTSAPSNYLVNLSYDYANANGKRTGQLKKILNNNNHNNQTSVSEVTSTSICHIDGMKTDIFFAHTTHSHALTT